MRRLKIKVVGDGGVGKTSFLIRWYYENFPDQDDTPLFPGRERILPSVQDTFFTNMTVDRESYVLTFWDTLCGADFQRFRPLEYEDTDVFLVFFDISNPTSFQNVSTVWVPELKHYMPGTPILVVGNKTDLRTSRYGRNCSSLSLIARVSFLNRSHNNSVRRWKALGEVLCSCFWGRLFNFHTWLNFSALVLVCNEWAVFWMAFLGFGQEQTDIGLKHVHVPRPLCCPSSLANWKFIIL